MDMTELKPGDVVTILWHDASVFRDALIFYSPTNPGSPGVCNLTVGGVVTNYAGYVRLAQDLSYIEPDDEPRTIKNSYIEIPHAWLDCVQVFGSALELLEDIWRRAKHEE